jgi:hypothetical protein
VKKIYRASIELPREFLLRTSTQVTVEESKNIIMDRIAGEFIRQFRDRITVTQKEKLERDAYEFTGVLEIEEITPEEKRILTRLGSSIQTARAFADDIEELLN